MQVNEPPSPPWAPPPISPPPPPEPTSWDKMKKFLGPIAVILILFAKFFGKLKFIVLPVLKFIPAILKTGGTMFLSVWLYAMAWGWWFAVGFVLLIFIHECGHLVAAKRIGLKVGAPVFIPFMGALIALKEAPKNAWIEAQVGIGGPLLGAMGAGICEVLYFATGNLMFRALAYTGFLLNLFNLAPVGFLDGGRIVTALSPWLWIVGYAIMIFLTVMRPNFILILILILSLPRIFFLFRPKTEEELRYFEVTPVQRWMMAVLYFGLIAVLVIGMHVTFIPREAVGR